MITKITGYSVLKTGEGYRVNVTSTKMDDVGILVENNHKDSFFVVNPDMQSKIIELEKMVQETLTIIESK
ncbi:hypothetical protein [Clostridium cadaveris]|uniref:hypothetical protein n=1 Tax=Clostridium cadaveris TaxID=1529 RepID=UPI0004841940|nr:hypothetical protein [Clostridium cadaveris]MDM8313615.1 hypothetical protein [Clostridium cadaveris]